MHYMFFEINPNILTTEHLTSTFIQRFYKRQTHSCDIKEEVETLQRRLFKKRADLINDLAMLEQGVIQDTLEKLLTYQVKRREMPEWEEVRSNIANWKEANSPLEGKPSQIENNKDNLDSDEEIEDKDMIDIMEYTEKDFEQTPTEDGTTTTVTQNDSRRGTGLSALTSQTRRESVAPEYSPEIADKESCSDQVGLFGMEMQDNEEEGEGMLPNQTNLGAARFSFIDSNLDKFTVLQFIENKALNISKSSFHQSANPKSGDS